jgi:geranylgeranyl diphosphate synthase, type I
MLLALQRSGYHAGAVNAFELYLKRNAGRVNRRLLAYFKDGSHPDMRTYLYNPLLEFTRASGKRHRPLICLLACEAVGGDPELAWESACAIEHFHTAALVHDDIEDASTSRRDQPCMHVRIGMPLALNAGDLALSLVCGTVVNDPKLDDACKVKVLAQLVEMTTRTIEGQALDIGWARDGRFDLTPQDYLTMAEHKTAYYSGKMPLTIGATIGGATGEQTEALGRFGLAIGTAFQIQDDVLNLIGTREATRKDFRSDITEAKRTLPAIHALSRGGPDSARLQTILDEHTSDPALLEEAVEILRRLGSIDYANEYARRVVLESKEALEDALSATQAKKLLLSMADYVIERQT